MVKYVAYYRVSTQKQGNSGYGIDAQRMAVLQFAQRELRGCADGQCIEKEFTEVQSGRNNDRAILQEALAYCKKNKCILVVGKLDRLSRDVEFLFKIQNSGVKFRCADLPELDTLTLGIFASFAQFEAERISRRTKEALAARKAKGLSKKVVNNLTPERIKAGHEARKQRANTQQSFIQVADLIKYKRQEDWTYRQIAEFLQTKGFKTSAGKDEWTPMQVQRIEKRFEAVAA